MSMTFTKLFSSITESTVWYEPDSTRLVWITMLAMSDRQGRVWASIPGLAGRARVAIEACRVALQCFLSPDPDSRTKDFEGRRIEEIEGGWRLLNHAKYRELRDEEERKVYQREWVRGKRHRRQKISTVDQGLPQSTYAEAEAEADTEKKEIPRARAPKGGRGISSEEEKTRASIREYIGNCPQYRDAPSTLAMLSKAPIELVKDELENYAKVHGPAVGVIAALAKSKRMK